MEQVSPVQDLVRAASRSSSQAFPGLRLREPQGRRSTRRNFGWVCAVALWLAIGLGGTGAGASPSVEATPVLARVNVLRAPAACSLPAYGLLQDAAGQDYFLVIAARSALAKLSEPWVELEAPSAAPEDYVVAWPMREGARAGLAGFKVLQDDGKQLVLRATAAEGEALAALGFALQRLNPEPMPTDAAPPAKGGDPWSPAFSSPPDARVAGLLSQVSATNLYWLLGRLTGEEAIIAGGSPFIISNRNTSSGPMSNALQYASERFQALGLETQLQNWSLYGYANRNLVATQPGGALSNELVLVTAHLDNMPTATRAPGADDNASGCAAVLATAGLFRQLQFERTVRYVLFTGEEQGTLGSAVYATYAYNNHLSIVGVLNLDMLAWDSTPPPYLSLYTRTTNSAGFSNDLAIVSLFTNCVAAYQLTNALSPTIIADGTANSDHGRFWNAGFPAAMVIEQYKGDFNPNYHTSRDSITNVNWPYFTAAVRGAVATAAHMARPAGTRAFGLLEVTDSNWQTAGGRGAGACRALWTDGAGQDRDTLDLAWSNAPAPTNPAWFRAASLNLGTPLRNDARPNDSDLVYSLEFSAVTTNAAPFPATNRLRFESLSGLPPDRLYLARLQVDPAFAGTNHGFPRVTNLLPVLNQGGSISWPPFTGLTNGALYGTCELAVRMLATNPADIPLRLLLDSTGAVLVTRGQVGCPIADELQTATSLTGPWESLDCITNALTPDAASFDTGWQELCYPLATNNLPERFIRLRRTWLPR